MEHIVKRIERSFNVQGALGDMGVGDADLQTFLHEGTPEIPYGRPVGSWGCMNLKIVEEIQKMPPLRFLSGAA